MIVVYLRERAKLEQLRSRLTETVKSDRKCTRLSGISVSPKLGRYCSSLDKMWLAGKAPDVGLDGPKMLENR